MNINQDVEIEVWTEGLRPKTRWGRHGPADGPQLRAESFQPFQTLHSLAPARLALRATFGGASRRSQRLGSQSTLTVFRRI